MNLKSKKPVNEYEYKKLLEYHKLTHSGEKWYKLDFSCFEKKILYFRMKQTLD
jgi:hypothetical protein